MQALKWRPSKIQRGFSTFLLRLQSEIRIEVFHAVISKVDFDLGGADGGRQNHQGDWRRKERERRVAG